jgi:hypothetical protein
MIIINEFTEKEPPHKFLGDGRVDQL